MYILIRNFLTFFHFLFLCGVKASGWPRVKSLSKNVISAGNFKSIHETLPLKNDICCASGQVFWVYWLHINFLVFSIVSKINNSLQKICILKRKFDMYLVYLLTGRMMSQQKSSPFWGVGSKKNGGVQISK